jgi:hypothetical protein
MLPPHCGVDERCHRERERDRHFCRYGNRAPTALGSKNDQQRGAAQLQPKHNPKREPPRTSRRSVPIVTAASRDAETPRRHPAATHEP